MTAIRRVAPLKSLAEFYEQKGRLHRLAFDLAGRPGLGGDLGLRLYHLLLLCDRYEQGLRVRLAAAGRSVDPAAAQLAAGYQASYRQRHGITRISPPTDEELAAVGYDSRAVAEQAVIRQAQEAAR